MKLKPYSDAELEALLAEGESDHVEFKESLKSNDLWKKICEAVCAFANDLPDRGKAGVIFIGIKNDGSSSELRVDDKLLTRLAGIKTDEDITPPPTLLAEKRHLNGHDLAVVTVSPCDTPPVRYKGRISVRWGPRRGFATAQDERILNERRRYRDRPFDVHPIEGATLDDLNRLRFEQEYLPSLVARDVLDANERTYEQRLASAKMIASNADTRPTVLGLLIVGEEPANWVGGAYAQFLRIDGNELVEGVVVDEEAIYGTVADQIRRLEEKIATHNLRSVRFADVERESRAEEYPMEALRQLVRNAFMHRNYEATNAPTRVYWFDDRIEIHNPGEPFGSVTLDNFGQPGVTDYRNPNLAEALKALGYVQKFGAGLAMAKKALGARLQFVVEQSYIAAIIAKDMP